MELPSIKVLVVALVILNLLDLLVSYVGVVMLGANEMNSFAFSLFANFWSYSLLKFIPSAILIVSVYKLPMHKIASYVVFPTMVLYLLVTINNVLWLIVR